MTLHIPLQADAITAICTYASVIRLTMATRLHAELSGLTNQLQDYKPEALREALACLSKLSDKCTEEVLNHPHHRLLPCSEQIVPTQVLQMRTSCEVGTLHVASWKHGDQSRCCFDWDIRVVEDFLFIEQLQHMKPLAQLCRWSVPMLLKIPRRDIQELIYHKDCTPFG